MSTRRAMHLTLHSKRAIGEGGLLRHRRTVREALRACAERNGVKVYDFANVGSHLHLLVRARRRENFPSSRAPQQMSLVERDVVPSSDVAGRCGWVSAKRLNDARRE